MNLWTDIRDFLFPRLCLSCGKKLLQSEDGLCISCFSSLPYTHLGNTSGNEMEKCFWGRFPVVRASSLFYYALNPQLHSRSATYIKRNGLLIRKITIKSSRPFQCAYHPLTP